MGSCSRKREVSGGLVAVVGDGKGEGRGVERERKRTVSIGILNFGIVISFSFKCLNFENKVKGLKENTKVSL